MKLRVLPAILVVLLSMGVFIPLSAESNDGGDDAIARELSRHVWANFKRYGTPRGGETAFAPGYSEESQETLRRRIPVKVFEILSGHPVFSKEPKDFSNSFKHVNPEFVRWITQHGIPGVDDAAFREATQTHYDTNFKNLAATYHAVLRQARANPRCFEREVKLWKAAVEKGDWAEHRRIFHRWGEFMADNFCESQYPNAPAPWGGQRYTDWKVATGFWVRRTIDSSADEFEAGLQRLLETYDPSLLDKAERSDQDYRCAVIKRLKRPTRMCSNPFDPTTCPDEHLSAERRRVYAANGCK